MSNVARLYGIIPLLAGGVAIAVCSPRGWWGVLGWIVFWIAGAIHDEIRDRSRGV